MTVLLRVKPLAILPRVRLPVSKPRHIAPAAAVSLALHVVVLGGAWWWSQRHPRAAVELEDNPAIVQLVMSPPGGESSAPTAPPKTDAPPAKETQQAKQTPTPPANPSPSDGEPPPQPRTQPAAAAQPKAAPDELQMSMPQAESDTNALVTGDAVLPASVDVKYHNRKPSYPSDAARRGEHGTVVLLAHVEADGTVSDIDVLRSSGHEALDRAAREAVDTWHFLPSIKDGQPVASDVPLRFDFIMD